MDSTHRFDGKATTYARYRPGYPEALVDYWYEELGFTPESAIADVGAGTGILSALLAARGSRVVAVEPNDDMRSEAVVSLDAYPRCRVVRGTAEETTLEDGSIDVVTAAQAFHWFDQNRFRSECRRILKAQGLVVLAWNARLANDVLMRENDAINRKYAAAYKGFTGGFAKSSTVKLANFFREGGFEYRKFANDLRLDEEGFIGRNLSSSYAPDQDSPVFEPYVGALRALFAKYAKNGTLVFPMSAYSFAGRV